MKFMSHQKSVTRKSNNTAFLITKPLQLIISLTIIDQLGLKGNVDLLIIDAFAKSSIISERLNALSPSWGVIKFFETHALAYKEAEKSQYKTIFIDTDIGLKKYLQLAKIKLKHPNKNIHVYEEGLGTYRNDLYKGFKRSIFNATGIGTYFGSSTFTSKIFIYNTKEYLNNTNHKNNHTIQINYTLSEFVKKYQNDFDFIFNVESLNFENTKNSLQNICTLYLSDWKIHESVLLKLKEIKHTKILKPHPHLKNTIAFDTFMVTDGSIPAEVLIEKLLTHYNTIHVYHHGSSVTRYIQSDRIQFYKLPANPR